MRVTVVYALPMVQHEIEVEVAADASLEQAIHASGILQRCPELKTGPLSTGVWGKRAALSARLRERDRVEIYRPLLAEPKEARRRRVAKSRSQT